MDIRVRMWFCREGGTEQRAKSHSQGYDLLLRGIYLAQPDSGLSIRSVTSC
jgi:hypothetical protein